MNFPHIEKALKEDEENNTLKVECVDDQWRAKLYTASYGTDCVEYGETVLIALLRLERTLEIRIIL